VRRTEDRDPFSDQVRRNLARVDAEPRNEPRGQSEGSQSLRRVMPPAAPPVASIARVRADDFIHPVTLREGG
jgi:hypothetical protein